ncbi:hypothetical protein BJ875DRAFT_509577 [Amylocarpus encephaloides]|uniref:Uncharacterized protein n=1 Tax=Amylocarpus encephaloides TaxID=45428 RepID=A0A9P7YJV9_9HELO|nr:hypothetical protein BJ875DRAFT_509577 [Amylocarpus encephaloides]
MSLPMNSHKASCKRLQDPSNRIFGRNTGKKKPAILSARPYLSDVDEVVLFGRHGNSDVPSLDNEAGTAASCTTDEAFKYHFVEVDESSGKVPRSTLTTVRAHVRRNVQRKPEGRQNLNLTIAPSVKGLQPGAFVSQPLPQKHRFNLGPQGLRETKTRLRKDKTAKDENIKTTHSIVQESTNSLQPMRTVNIAPQTNPTEGQQMQHYMAENISGIEKATTFNSLLEQRAFEAVPLSVRWGVLDPFNSLPEIPHSRQQVLLFYANQIVSSSQILGKLRHAWLEYCVRDEALLHITLAHFAGDHSAEQRQIDEVEAIRLKTGAMTIVNDRLSVVKTAVVEGMIGAVACIASYQSYYAVRKGAKYETRVLLTVVFSLKESIEQLHTAHIHIYGLKKLLEVKGGGLKHGISPIILLCRTDLTYANAMGTDLIFPLSEYTALRFSNETWGQQPMGLEEMELRSSPLDLQLLGPKIDCLVSNLRELLRLTPECESASSKSSTIQQSDELLINQAMLLNLAEKNPSSKLVQLCASTIMIILDNYTRGVNFNTYVMARKFSKIRVVITEEMDHGSGSEMHLQICRMILWSVFVGGVAAAAKPSASWFSSQIACLCARLGLEDWTGIRSILISFLWPMAWDDVRIALCEGHRTSDSSRQDQHSNNGNGEDFPIVVQC